MIKLILIIMVIAFEASAVSLAAQDSLYVLVSGGASVTNESASGSKAVEDGILRATLCHTFTSAISATVTVKGSRNSSDAFLEEGSINFCKANYSLSGGFLLTRLGFASLYRPHSIFYFLFDRALLWDVNGFGIASEVDFKNGIGLGAGSTLNSRESGQIYGTMNFAGKRIQASALTGFQSYSAQNQDNSFTEGGSVFLDYARVKIHALASYMHYLGYGRAANVTMVPGKKFTGLLESEIAPCARLTGAAQIYYENYSKNFNHEFMLSGIEATWMAFSRIGFGSGFEYQKDDGFYTGIPRMFLVFVPLPQKTDMRLSFQQSTLNGTPSVYSLMGEVWFRF